jgi:hypothetical protein
MYGESVLQTGMKGRVISMGNSMVNKSPLFTIVEGMKFIVYRVMAPFVLLSTSTDKEVIGCKFCITTWNR